MRSVNEHYKQHGNQDLIAALAPVTSQHEALKSISLGGVSGASWREGVAQSCRLKIFKEKTKNTLQELDIELLVSRITSTRKVSRVPRSTSVMCLFF